MAIRKPVPHIAEPQEWDHPYDHPWISRAVEHAKHHGRKAEREHEKWAEPSQQLMGYHFQAEKAGLERIQHGFHSYEAPEAPAHDSNLAVKLLYEAA